MSGWINKDCIYVAIPVEDFVESVRVNSFKFLICGLKVSGLDKLMVETRGLFVWRFCWLPGLSEFALIV